MADSWREHCRCGAEFEYPATYGMDELEQWRKNHSCDVIRSEPAHSSTADEGRRLWECTKCGERSGVGVGDGGTTFYAASHGLPNNCHHTFKIAQRGSDEGRCADCGIGEWADGPGGADDDPIETHDAGWVASGGHPFQPQREPIEEQLERSSAFANDQQDQAHLPIEEQEAPAPEPVEEGWRRMYAVQHGRARPEARWQSDSEAVYVPIGLERAIRAPLEAENARLREERDYCQSLIEQFHTDAHEALEALRRAPDEVQEGRA